MNKITAQVATEAIINMPDAFDKDTAEIVLADAIELGVADFYTNMLHDIIAGIK